MAVKKFSELSNRVGAEKLATRIEDYWAQRGKSPKIWIDVVHIVKADNTKLRDNAIYCVRSNMINGCPVE